MGEFGIGISPLQAADLDRRKERVAKLVKVSLGMAGKSPSCTCMCLARAVTGLCSMFAF